MMTIDEMGKKLDRYIEACNDLDWTVNIGCDKPGEWYAELGWGSPAGEDFWTTAYFKDAEDFIKGVRTCAKEFDPDHNVEIWVDRRGQGGCPDTIRELMDDAEAIQKSLNELADALQALDDPEFAKALEERAKSEARAEELSYVDLLNELRLSLLSDYCMPKETQEGAIKHLDALAELLWPYSA